ncbi:MAG TPA: hypothetical protein VG406_24995 [Isosphaeraceae bacterium]|jgi:hypothetical protein|nr:hypothetical protein [Isosphaeraceae bacterium]
MRRIFSATLILGVLALPLTFLAGCGETTSSTSSTEIKTPSGKDKVESTVKETTTGDMKENK